MPELIEVEWYRQLADAVVDSVVTEVNAPDSWFLKRGLTPSQVEDALVGATVTATARRGKLLMLELAGERPVLGLRFGMTGRLVLDGEAPIQRLEYASGRDDPVWNRFGLGFGDGRTLRISDPRRLGGVELDPDVFALGPDAWELTTAELRAALAGSNAALKARLLDQSRIAGLGNLLVDEILWRVEISPTRTAGSLDPAELRRLAGGIRRTIALLAQRGGSHTGDLQSERHRDGHCPLDGSPLSRDQVGGRTTYWCRLHQR